MYANDYFVRFLNSAAQAEQDLSSGHSYYPGEEDEQLDGLSGFGPFETVEEAEERCQEGFLMYSHAAIFVGKYVGPDPDEGDLFRPIEVVKVFEV